MKKIIVSLALSIVTLTGAHAQMNSGRVNYKIDFSSPNPEMEMAISMMQGSTLEILFDEAKTRSEIKMGTLMAITTITNPDEDGALILLSGMAGSKAVKTTLSELVEKNESAKDQPEFNVELLDETKEILGYTCKKAVLTNEDGVEVTYWYTEDVAVNKSGQSYLNETVPGFPMEFEMHNGEMHMHFVADLFEPKLDEKAKNVFSLAIPEGYDTLTLEQLTQVGM